MQFKIQKKLIFIISFFSLIFNIASASSFYEKIRDIRVEINRDNLGGAIKLLEEIEIENEVEQDEIYILYGDIYLKINKPKKAEEFYEKAFFTTNKYIESLSLTGLAEVNLIQGKLDYAIKFSEQSISINPERIKPKIILAIAKTRVGDADEALKILNEIHKKNISAEIALTISDYYVVFDDYDKAIDILGDFLKRVPNNIKVLNQIASLYLLNNNEEKAIDSKLKVLKFYEINRNTKKATEAKTWITSVDPTYFDEPFLIEIIEEEEIEDYVNEEVENYHENKITPNYEDFSFAPVAHGSGFIIDDGKFVITNYHVIESASKISVRNGTGGISEAIVSKYSKVYDLALLKLKNPYPKEFSINFEDFVEAKAGEDVISIGYPGIGLTFELPTITQGIVSKVLDDEEGIFLTTAAINQGNSGGPVFNLKGQLVGISFAGLDKLSFTMMTGWVPTDMGFAIKSNKVNELLKYNVNTLEKRSKIDKTKIYENKLPSIVFIGIK